MGRVQRKSMTGQSTSALVKLFILQLTKGCGSAACISTFCHTYRMRTADRPYRPWSTLSARAMAFQLASEPNAANLLCHDVNGNALLEVSEDDLETLHALRIADHGPVDEKSMTQSLFDTDGIIEFINDGGNLSRSQRSYLRTMQCFDRDLDAFSTRLRDADNDESIYSLVDIFVSSLHSLLKNIDAEDWPCHTAFKHSRRMSFLTSDHTSIHIGLRLAKLINHLIRECTGERPQHAQTVHDLLLLALDGTGESRGTQERHQEVVTSPFPPKDPVLSETTLTERVLSRRDMLGLANFPKHSLLFEVMTAVFLKSWDGGAQIPARSSASEALSAMDWLETHFGPIYQRSPHVYEFLTDRLDLVGMVEQTIGKIEPSLFSHTWLFSPLQQAAMFRARRLLKMQDVIDDTNLVSKLLATEVSHLSHDYYHETQDLRYLQLRNAPLTVFYIEGHRNTALTNAFNALWRRDVHDLLRPLRVFLDGVVDIGQDAGGVAQEFLQLCWVQAVNPDLGMFTIDDQTRMAWFSPYCMEPPHKYELLGVLFALSVHNGFVLPVTFPLALYKKLLGKPVESIKDIEDGWPDIAKGLSQIRDWDDLNGTVEDVFGLTFDFAVAAFDETYIYNMTKAGSVEADSKTSTPKPVVTSANRNEYISLYIEWLTFKSIAPQITAFIKGFHSLLPITELKCLDPEALRLLAEGDQVGADFSIDLLRKHTKYGGGYYNNRSITIHHFWKIAHEWTATQKRQFLMFVTASDRLPVSGEKGLMFEIVRQTLDVHDYDHEPETLQDLVAESVPLIPAEYYAAQFNTATAAATTTQQRSDMHDTLHDSVLPSASASQDRRRTLNARTKRRVARMLRDAPLPTSNTCFARLNLPDYGDEEVLRAKLDRALSLGWMGFGLA